jgi:hypothetical protein
MFMSKQAPLGLFVGVLLSLAGCSDDKGGKNVPSGPVSFCDFPTECQQIAQACMPKDIGEGQVHECHLTGMVKGIEADCQKDLQPCLTACNLAPALTDGAVENLLAGCRD